MKSINRYRKPRLTILSIVILLMLSGTIFPFLYNSSCTNMPDKNQNRILFVDDDGDADYTSIQDAIDNASEGDTIFVHRGIYYENLTIDKTLYLIGEDRDETIIDSCYSRDTITVTAPDVVISNFTIQNAGRCAVLLKREARGTKIFNNIIRGGEPSSIYSRASDVEITNNFILNSYHGIHMIGVTNVTIRWNLFHNDGTPSLLPSAIWLEKAKNSTITENLARNMEIAVDFESRNVTVNRNKVIGGSIELLYCVEDCIVSGNTLLFGQENVWQGLIYIGQYSNHNEIVDNFVYGGHIGIDLWEKCKENIIKLNTVMNCKRGIHLSCHCKYNSIVYNNLIGNVVNAYDDDINTWFKNYYSDYDGYDANGDGIGDIPYQIKGGDNQDNYPYMEPNGWLTWVVARTNGVYSGTVNEPIQFSATTAGGTEPYNFTWTFYDGTVLSGQNVTYSFPKPGVYEVSLTVSDKYGCTDTDSTVVIIIEKFETTPPQVNITKPVNAIYWNNEEILPFFKPIIFGPIDITVEAWDESGVDRALIYIDDDFKYKFKFTGSANFSWRWDIEEFGKHTIKVIVYDNIGNKASKELEVWKFF